MISIQHNKNSIDDEETLLSIIFILEITKVIDQIKRKK